MLINHRDLSSIDSVSKMQFCPAYHFCNELKRPYRLSKFDGNQIDRQENNKQITALIYDVLRAINKESAIRLIRLIVNDIEKRWKSDGSDSQVRYHPDESKRYKRSDKQYYESGLILATTTSSSSVCALCGAALNLNKNPPLKESEQFVFDEERKDHDCNILKAFDKEREYIFEARSIIDTNESSLKSKLLFIRRISSGKRSICQIYQTESQQRHDDITQMLRHVDSKHEYNVIEMSKPEKLTRQNSRIVYTSPTISSSTRDASTLTHREMFCPCACGLPISDEIKSEVSIKSVSMLKENFIETELEEPSFYLNSNQITKMYNDIQKLKKDINIERWREKVIQLQLQTQVKELQKNIRFFKQENKYIRHLIEKCRCSLKIKFFQELLPITATYSGLTSAIKCLQAKYYDKNGIITTLTQIFRNIFGKLQENF